MTASCKHSCYTIRSVCSDVIRDHNLAIGNKPLHLLSDGNVMITA